MSGWLWILYIDCSEYDINMKIPIKLAASDGTALQTKYEEQTAVIYEGSLAHTGMQKIRAVSSKDKRVKNDGSAFSLYG